MIGHPTEQQARAISLHGPNLIVSAAAGSGKTAVMIERAVDMLMHGANVDQLLMLTFTNAAAAQMRQRIVRELGERIPHVSASVATHLSEQANRIDGADISTINAYCVRLVRQYFHLVDVDPLFALAGEGEQSVLCAQAMRTLMDECFEESSESFLFALEALCGHVEEDLCSMILSVYRFAQTSADPVAWLSRAVMAYQGGELTRVLLQRDLAHLLPRFKNMSTLCEKAAAYVKANRGPGKPLKMTETLMQNANAYLTMSVMPHPPNIVSLIKQAKPPSISIRNARMDEDAFAPLGDMLHQIKDQFDEIKDQPLLNQSLEQALEDLSVIAQPMRELQSLVNRFEDLYRQVKQEHNLLDFSDVEHLALRILNDAFVADTLRARYACVFVDEYQDTNDLQEALIVRLAKPGALFCVGDVKQSIYAFRHAEPALFLRRYMRSVPDGPNSRSAAEVRLDLNTNFRSTRNILYLVNGVFSKTMRLDHGGLDYDQSQALSPGLEDEGSPISLHLLMRDDQASPPDNDAQPRSARERQAVACASRINALLQERFFDGRTWRNYRFDDIAILLRKLSTIGPAFVSALNELGIPVSCSARGDVLSAQETGAMLALLKVVDNARDDVSMLAALRSPAALLSARDLANIRAYDKTLPFALCAQNFAKNGTGISAQRVRTFFKKLEQYRTLSRRVRVDKLLSHLYEDTHALAYYALLPDGEAKVENLWALLFRAQTFARLDDGSLYGFLQLIKLHSELGVSEITAAPGGSNAVKVMTIHGAKGLEFPAVILPFLESPLKTRGRAHLPLSREDGIGIRYYDTKSQTHRKSAIQHIVEAHALKLERDEQLRLLYVALTRAQHSLSLMGEVTATQLERALTASPYDAANTLSWILPSLRCHAACASLCDALSLPQEIKPSPCALTLDCLDEAALHALSASLISPPSLLQDEPTHMDTDFVSKRLTYRYPYAHDILVPEKISVSALHARTAIPFEPLEPPNTDQNIPMDAAMIGTAVHKAMLKISFDGVDSPGHIGAQLDHMVQFGLLDDAQRGAIDPVVLYDFFQTALGRRLLRAQRVLREQPFVLRVPAKVYDADLNALSTTSLQGIIDCAFYENGGWVLLDYKTNRLPKGGLPALQTQYQVQMDAYRFALETLTGSPVNQCTLCLLMLHEQLDVPPSETYRKLSESYSD